MNDPSFWLTTSACAHKLYAGFTLDVKRTNLIMDTQWHCCCFCYSFLVVLVFIGALAIEINAVYKCELCECNCVHLFILVFYKRIVSFGFVYCTQIHTYKYMHWTPALYNIYTACSYLLKVMAISKNKGDQVNGCYRKRFWCYSPHSNSTTATVAAAADISTKSRTIFRIHRVLVCANECYEQSL